MKMTYFLFLLSIFFSSCSPEKREALDLNKGFQTAIHQLNPNENTKDFLAYLVIPNTGCSGCISSAETLLMENYKKVNKIKFILTRIESIKNLNLKLHIDVKNEPNILLDVKDLFSQGEFNSIYPQGFIVDPKSGKIIKKTQISPSVDGVQELTKLLSTSE